MKTIKAETMSYWSLLMLLVLEIACQQYLAKPVKVGECEVNLFRLPTRVQPTNYHLQLWLNPESVDFIGQVIIDLNIRDTMDSEEFLQSRTIGREVPPSALDPRSIILNVDGLQVIRWEFKQNNIPWGVESICQDAENNILVVTLEKELIPEPDTQLIFNFKGEVQTDGNGLFTSDVSSAKALISNFVPTYARRLFPCFDEPEFKATFRLTIWHPSGTIALSNMRVSKYDIPTTGFVGTFFEPTPKMSSYLLSMAVGKFSSSARSSLVDGTEITIYVPEDYKEYVSYMSNKAVQAYDKMSQYFNNLSKPAEEFTKLTDSLENVPKPLEKIDIVAVNSNYFATDSLGLISMRFDLLAASEKLTSPDHLTFINTLLMTVMIQQRLGNLATVRWWDDLWLKEGLATHLASELTAELHPEIRSDLFTLLDSTFYAMNYDENPKKTHPIKNKDLKKTEDIKKSLDYLTRMKSESLFRMFSRYIGKEKFDWAVRDFIISHVYQVVDAKDWWDTLSQYASESDNLIGEAHLWTEQAGYPIIYVSLTEGDRLHVSQKSSLRNGQVWPVPITLKLYGDPKGKKFYLVELVLSKSGPIEIDLPDWFNLEDEFQWLKFNLDHAGYYRVVYESDLLREALVRAVENGWTLAADRLQLLNDSYAHGKRSGSMKEFEKLLLSFSEEKNDGVMLLLAKLLTEHNEKLSKDLRKMANNLMKQYHDLNGGVWGPAGKDNLKQYARGAAINYLVNILKNKEVKKELKEYKYYVLSNDVEWPGFLDHLISSKSKN